MSDLDDLLKDDEEIVSFIPSVPSAQGNAPGNVPGAPSIPNHELEELKAQIAQQAAEIQRFKNIPSTQPSWVQPQVQPQQPQNQYVPSTSRAQLKEQLQNAYLADPAEAMLNLYEMAKKEAIEEARKNMVPVAGQTTRFAIDQFRKSQNLLSDEAEEFDNLVGQISDAEMANANPAFLSKQLEILKHAARGAALEKRTNKPQVRVPMYNAGSGVPNVPGSKVNVKLTKGQKAFWDMGVENGLKPEQIMEVINGDDGQGGIA
jgi:hypothetical protein